MDSRDATTAPAGGRVVVGVDDTHAGIAAVQEAVRLARTTGAQLVAVRSWALGLPRHGGRRRPADHSHPHVILYFDVAGLEQASADIVGKVFRIAVGGIPRDVTVTIKTPEGDPGPALTDVARAAGDVLVVGEGHRPSLRHLLHGSVSRYCDGHAHCPVVVVPGGPDRGVETHR
jgi:nucleotide-binding universal stress UspA family protein